MSIILLQVDGQPFVQAVALHDPTFPAITYARTVKTYLDPAATLRYCEVDLSPMSEYGPDDVANFLSQDSQDEYGVTDLPQRWEVA